MIKGLEKAKTERVDISGFFGGVETWVETRPLPPARQARIDEIVTRSFRYNTSGEGRKLDVQSIENSLSAQDALEIREIKLTYGVVDHNIETDSGKGEWNSKLWEEMDEANPAVLEKVLDAINDLNDREGGEENPTSARKKSKR